MPRGLGNSGSWRGKQKPGWYFVLKLVPLSPWREGQWLVCLLHEFHVLRNQGIFLHQTQVPAEKLLKAFV